MNNSSERMIHHDPSTATASIPVMEILFLNHYRCRRCNTTFHVPNPHLMYMYNNPYRPGVTLIQPQGHGFDGLPRCVRDAPEILLDACSSCFVEKSWQPQSELQLGDLAPKGEDEYEPTPLSLF